MTDPKGQVFTYNYDALHRLTTLNRPDEVVNYTYDALGNRLSLQDATGVTAYDYDDLNRLTADTDPLSQTVQYTYDAEAARLVLQAAAIGESGQVLVLDMGEPVKIVDLARDLIRLAGHAGDGITIEYSGLRPGEKLYEELLADEDATLPTVVPRLRIAMLDARPAPLDELLALAADGNVHDDEAVRAALARSVSGYQRGTHAASPPG
jgi:YD repeat-containing protein